MVLTDEQRHDIFEQAQIVIDTAIEHNGYFDDTNTNDLEDIILDILFMAVDKKDFDEIMTDYNNIIDLTTDFLTWLFDKNTYDKAYYEDMQYIRTKI